MEREQEIKATVHNLKKAWKSNPELRLGELIAQALPAHCDGSPISVSDRELSYRLLNMA